MSIFIRVTDGLTGSEPSGYSVSMPVWGEVLLLLCLTLFQPAATVHAVALPEPSESVPADEYPFYDLAVDAKFLTSQTRLVVLERMTTMQLDPDKPQPPTVAWFAEQPLFDGRLPQDLIRDFVAKNQRPARLEARFAFGVRYRFVSGAGEPENETAVPAVPAAWPVQNLDLDTIDRLAFSRVGLTLRGDQALLYVANNRPDNTGAGFLIWFVRRQGTWELYDTEVIWVAKIDRGAADGP